MGAGVARNDRRLPAWLGGPVVSELAYRIVLVAFEGRPPYGARSVVIAPADHVSTVELVEALAERLDADEAEVLRALAELQRKGVLLNERGRV